MIFGFKYSASLNSWWSLSSTLLFWSFSLNWKASFYCSGSLESSSFGDEPSKFTQSHHCRHQLAFIKYLFSSRATVVLKFNLLFSTGDRDLLHGTTVFFRSRLPQTGLIPWIVVCLPYPSFSTLMTFLISSLSQQASSRLQNGPHCPSLSLSHRHLLPFYLSSSVSFLNST